MKTKSSDKEQKETCSYRGGLPPGSVGTATTPLRTLGTSFFGPCRSGAVRRPPAVLATSAAATVPPADCSILLSTEWDPCSQESCCSICASSSRLDWRLVQNCHDLLPEMARFLTQKQ